MLEHIGFEALVGDGGKKESAERFVEMGVSEVVFDEDWNVLVLELMVFQAFIQTCQ